MKSIELTEEHKAKLLEMCKVLFPELDICLTGQSGRAWDSKNECFINIYNVKGSDTLIHWFEFCLTHLFLKVFPDTKSMMFGKPCTQSNSIEHYNYLIHWLAGYQENYFGKKVNLKTYHPIDYLYKHFKKLKQ